MIRSSLLLFTTVAVLSPLAAGQSCFSRSTYPFPDMPGCGLTPPIVHVCAINSTDADARLSALMSSLQTEYYTKLNSLQGFCGAVPGANAGYGGMGGIWMDRCIEHYFLRNCTAECSLSTVTFLPPPATTAAPTTTGATTTSAATTTAATTTSEATTTAATTTSEATTTAATTTSVATTTQSTTSSATTTTPPPTTTAAPPQYCCESLRDTVERLCVPQSYTGGTLDSWFLDGRVPSPLSNMYGSTCSYNMSSCVQFDYRQFNSQMKNGNFSSNFEQTFSNIAGTPMNDEGDFRAGFPLFRPIPRCHNLEINGAAQNWTVSARFLGAVWRGAILPGQNWTRGHSAILSVYQDIEELIPLQSIVITRTDAPTLPGRVYVRDESGWTTSWNIGEAANDGLEHAVVVVRKPGKMFSAFLDGKKLENPQMWQVTDPAVFLLASDYAQDTNYARLPLTTFAVGPFYGAVGEVRVRGFPMTDMEAMDVFPSWVRAFKPANQYDYSYYMNLRAIAREGHVPLSDMDGFSFFGGAVVLAPPKPGMASPPPAAVGGGNSSSMMTSVAAAGMTSPAGTSGGGGGGGGGMMPSSSNWEDEYRGYEMLQRMTVGSHCPIGTRVHAIPGWRVDDAVAALHSSTQAPLPGVQRRRYRDGTTLTQVDIRALRSGNPLRGAPNNMTRPAEIYRNPYSWMGPSYDGVSLPAPEVAFALLFQVRVQDVLDMIDFYMASNGSSTPPPLGNLTRPVDGFGVLARLHNVSWTRSAEDALIARVDQIMLASRRRVRTSSTRTTTAPPTTSYTGTTTTSAATTTEATTTSVSTTTVATTTAATTTAATTTTRATTTVAPTTTFPAVPTVQQILNRFCGSSVCEPVRNATSSGLRQHIMELVRWREGTYPPGMDYWNYGDGTVSGSGLDLIERVARVTRLSRDAGAMFSDGMIKAALDMIHHQLVSMGCWAEVMLPRASCPSA